MESQLQGLSTVAHFGCSSVGPLLVSTVWNMNVVCKYSHYYYYLVTWLWFVWGLGIPLNVYTEVWCQFRSETDANAKYIHSCTVVSDMCGLAVMWKWELARIRVIGQFGVSTTKCINHNYSICSKLALTICHHPVTSVLWAWTSSCNTTITNLKVQQHHPSLCLRYEAIFTIRMAHDGCLSPLIHLVGVGIVLSVPIPMVSMNYCHWQLQSDWYFWVYSTQHTEPIIWDFLLSCDLHQMKCEFHFFRLARDCC